eukprot:2099352-Prymnesium_polylepis.1
MSSTLRGGQRSGRGHVAQVARGHGTQSFVGAYACVAQVQVARGYGTHSFVCAYACVQCAKRGTQRGSAIGSAFYQLIKVSKSRPCSMRAIARRCRPFTSPFRFVYSSCLLYTSPSPRDAHES